MTNTTITATYTNATNITATYGNQNIINVTAPISTILNSTTTKVNYLGSACTGNDGDMGRTLTHTKSIGTNGQVIRNRAFLIPTIDYTTLGAVITFNINIDNSDTIVVMT